MLGALREHGLGMPVLVCMATQSGGHGARCLTSPLRKAMMPVFTTIAMPS